MREIKLRQEVEHLQLGCVLRSRFDVGAEKLLEAEIEHAQVGGKPHGLRRGGAVARVFALDAREVVERLAGVPRRQIRGRRFRRHARVGVELRGVGVAAQRPGHARRVGESPQLHVCVEGGLVLSLLLHLLRRDDRDRLAADGRAARLGQKGARLVLPRLRAGEPRRSDLIARSLQQLDRAPLLAQPHEELHGQLVLARLAEEDGGHERALLARRIELADLRRQDVQALEQELARVARPLGRAQHTRGILERARVAKQLHRRVGLAGLLQATRLLQRLFLRLGIHQSSGNSEARRFSVSGWLASLRASSSSTVPSLTSRNSDASRLSIPDPSNEAVSR